MFIMIYLVGGNKFAREGHFVRVILSSDRMKAFIRFQKPEDWWQHRPGQKEVDPQEIQESTAWFSAIKEEAVRYFRHWILSMT